MTEQANSMPALLVAQAEGQGAGQAAVSWRVRILLAPLVLGMSLRLGLREMPK